MFYFNSVVSFICSFSYIEHFFFFFEFLLITRNTINFHKAHISVENSDLRLNSKVSLVHNVTSFFLFFLYNAIYFPFMWTILSGTEMNDIFILLKKKTVSLRDG